MEAMPAGDARAALARASEEGALWTILGRLDRAWDASVRLLKIEDLRSEATFPSHVLRLEIALASGDLDLAGIYQDKILAVRGTRADRATETRAEIGLLDLAGRRGDRTEIRRGRERLDAILAEGPPPETASRIELVRTEDPARMEAIHERAVAADDPEMAWRAAFRLARFRLGRRRRAEGRRWIACARSCYDEAAEGLLPDDHAAYLAREDRRRILRLEVACEGDERPTPLARLRHLLYVLDESLPSDGPDDLHAALLDRALELVGGLRAVLALAPEADREVRSGRHAEGRELSNDEIAISSSVVREALRTGLAVRSANLRLEEAFRLAESVTGSDLRSVLCVPLWTHGRRFGALFLDDPGVDGRYDELDAEILTAFAGHAALVLDQVRLLGRARTDSLTGLLNHAHFEQRLEEEVQRAARHGRNFAVLVMDVDRFKAINDAHGHAFGNEVIRAIARVLDAGLRPYDLTGVRDRAEATVLARFGGDEFEVLLSETDRPGLEAVASRVLREVRALDFETGHGRLAVTVSIGGAVYPDHGQTAADLFHAADESLYEAKHRGRDRFHAPGEGDGARPAGRSGGKVALAMLQRILEQGRDVGQALRQCLEATSQVVRADRGFLFLLEEGSLVRFRATFGIEESELDPGRLPLSFGCVTQVVSSGEPLLIQDAPGDAWAMEQESLVRMGVYSLLCVPIRVESRLIGILYLDTLHSGKAFRPEDLELVRGVAEQVALPLERSVELSRQTETIFRLEARLAESLRDLQARYRFDEIVGRSPAMASVFALLEKVIPLDYPVVIHGETGCGKELVAKAIHFNGPRRDQPFFPVNCAAVSDTLLESELFGHRKGAFTGADADRQGYFELADRGTLFLDEIEEMSEAMQGKLLRVLQEKKVRPVGSGIELPIDVRILVATNRDLRELVAKGEFRQDLFYRIDVVRIDLPPLRERREDIPLLVERLLDRIAGETGRRPTIAPEALAVLSRYDWPGNVRQLENELRRMAVVGGPVLGTGDLSPTFREPDFGAGRIAWQGSLEETIEAVERGLIQKALAENDGNIRATARALGMSHTTLLRRMEKYGLAAKKGS